VRKSRETYAQKDRPTSCDFPKPGGTSYGNLTNDNTGARALYGLKAALDTTPTSIPLVGTRVGTITNVLKAMEKKSACRSCDTRAETTTVWILMFRPTAISSRPLTGRPRSRKSVPPTKREPVSRDRAVSSVHYAQQCAHCCRSVRGTPVEQTEFLMTGVRA
jgi:hypothetical protein